MILVVGGTKGGSGKTLLASNLTVLRASAGHDTLLIDADEQASTMDFTRQRQHRLTGEPGYTAIQTREADVAVQVRRFATKYAEIVIDVGGRDTASQRAALAVADLLLIPFAPTSVDLWTVDTVIALLKEARVFNPQLQAALLNKAFPRGPDNREAAELLQEHPEHWSYLAPPHRHPQSLQQCLWWGVCHHRVSPQGCQSDCRNDGPVSARISYQCRMMVILKLYRRSIVPIPLS
jgi:chromosome partitioning protein